MGEDKSKIKYHDKTQLIHTAEMLSELCAETYISIGSKGMGDSEGYPEISDSYEDLGPLGGILSAFEFDSEVAWLTIACDLPYLNSSTLALLVANRNQEKLASCFYNPESKAPEPLITIWEPKAYPVMLDHFRKGQSSPRIILIDSDVEMIEMVDPTRMKNANTPEEKRLAEIFISKDSKFST